MRPNRIALLASIVGVLLLGLINHLWDRWPSEQARYAALQSVGYEQRLDGSVVPGESHAVWMTVASAGSRRLRLGWFPAPRHLRFAVRGDSAPVRMSAVLEVAPISVPLATHAVAANWSVVDCDLPPGFVGWSMAIDVEGAGAGFEVSEPFGPATGGTSQYGFARTLMAAGVNLLLYGLAIVAAARWLSGRPWSEAHWTPLLATAMVAILGYLVFWAFFASPTLGRIFAWALFAGSLGYLARTGGRLEGEGVGTFRLGALLALAGVAVLNLYPSKLAFYELAQHRFVADLAGDNRLPFDFANLLDHGVRPRELGAGWLSSDRPPLEEGWQLLAWPVTAALGFPADTASGTAAMLLQLSWVFALYGLLRSLGLGPDRARLWCAVAAMNGFFLVNTLYTWPKLASGAFGAAAFGFWIVDRPLSPWRLACGAVLSALALLAHGGIVFSLLPLAPWLVSRLPQRSLRPQWAVLGAAALLLPWAGFQHFFAPPGNRLLKWHLAGHTELDNQTLWTALRGAYGRLSGPEILAQKGDNFALLFQGDWLHAFAWSSAALQDRRMAEFYHLFLAAGIWNIGLVAFAIGVVVWRRDPRRGEATRRGAALLLWILASVTLWCLLLFSRTIVHQGSYAVPLALFAAAALGFEQLGRWAWRIVALVQAYLCVATWLAADRPPSVAPVVLLLGVGATLLFCLGTRAGPGKSPGQGSLAG